MSAPANIEALREALQAYEPSESYTASIAVVSEQLASDPDQRAAALIRYRRHRARLLAENGWRETAKSEGAGAVARVLSALG